MKLRIGILSTASIVPRLIGAVREAENLMSAQTESTSPSAAQPAGGSLEGCVVSAIASRSLEKARQKAELWGIPKAFGSYEELIQDPEIDIVYIAVINSEHYRLTKLALGARKHVFCEKPFTLEAGQARELFALARDRGLFLMEMQKTVFLPVICKVRELIQSGSFGPITMADFSSSYAPDYNGWFFDAAKGGGPLYGNAEYSLQLMQYLLGCFASEWTGLRTKSGTGVEDQFSLVVRMEDDTLYTNKTSMRSETIHTGYIYGEKGYIEIPDYWKARKALLHYKGKSEPVVLEAPCEYELMYEVLHGEACIRQGLTESPVMTEEMTVRALEVLADIQKLWNPAPPDSL